MGDSYERMWFYTRRAEAGSHLLHCSLHPGLLDILRSQDPRIFYYFVFNLSRLPLTRHRNGFRICGCPHLPLDSLSHPPDIGQQLSCLGLQCRTQLFIQDAHITWVGELEDWHGF